MKFCECIEYFYSKEPMSTAATALWLKLFYLSCHNKKPTLTFKQHELQAELGFGRHNTLSAARQELVEAGLLVVSKPVKGKPMEYTLTYGGLENKQEVQVQEQKQEAASNVPATVPVVAPVPVTEPEPEPEPAIEQGLLVPVEEMPVPVKPKRKRKPKQERKAYGFYGKCLLTDDQLETLKKEFPDSWEYWIDKADGYCESKGTTYSNFLAAIRNWSKANWNRGGRKMTATMEKQKAAFDAVDSYFKNVENEEQGLF